MKLKELYKKKFTISLPHENFELFALIKRCFQSLTIQHAMKLFKSLKLWLKF